MLNVAIAVDPGAHYGPETVHVIVAACEQVLGEGRCPAASELGPGMVTAWYAQVHPDDPGLGSARIEFRDRAADGILIEERFLTFPRGANQQGRLASIGSVIAALAAAREGAPIPSRPRPKLPEPSVPPVRTAPPQPSSPPDWSVELAAFATPSLGAGPYRLGALGSAQVGFESPPFARVSGSYAVHPGNPRLSWLGVSAGLGTRLAERAARFNVELGAEFVFQHTSATAQRGTDQETAAQNGWGGRIGAGAVWAGWRHASLVSGVDATLILPRVHVTVGGQNVTQVPLVSVALFLGVRLLP